MILIDRILQQRRDELNHRLMSPEGLDTANIEAAIQAGLVTHSDVVKRKFEITNRLYNNNDS
ncbi:hypothetical protein A4L_06 [Anabaena phage A-4L]|uniref:Uncharacterized protein n=1 Tax=Anabaena phage A-4L TaxID=1357732 RepID=A0A059PYD7_9CAUD|nr:hypothetical protein A4L_06 [Anabaena phage A-4L]AGR48533.1 hypothetical protein A4L_06 [Anabaena phage A-4L]